MEEKIKVLISIEIPRLSKDIDVDSIRLELNRYVKMIVASVNIQNLGDWSLLINVLAQRTDAISVSKRVARFPSDKECAIYISTPIPDDDQVMYGLPIVKEAFNKASNEKYSYILNPDFNSYSNLQQYFIESSKRAIDLAFTYGLTCNGKRIKFQK